MFACLRYFRETLEKRDYYIYSFAILRLTACLYVSPSVSPHGASRFPQDSVLENFILSRKFVLYLYFLNANKKQLAFYVQFHIHFNIWSSLIFLNKMVFTVWCESKKQPLYLRRLCSVWVRAWEWINSWVSSMNLSILY